MGERYERKYMAHYIKSDENLESNKWERLGEDLEEFNIEMNPMITVERNILDRDYIYHDGYEPTASVSPYYARVGTDLFNRLQAIIDNEFFGERCAVYILDVHLWDNIGGDVYRAVRRKAYVGIDSYGGDYTAYQIPFTLTIQSCSTTPGRFNISSGAFVAD